MGNVAILWTSAKIYLQWKQACIEEKESKG